MTIEQQADELYSRLWCFDGDGLHRKRVWPELIAVSLRKAQRTLPRSGTTRPGLTELQEGVLSYVYAFGAGVLCGIVVGVMLAVIGGVGLAAWYNT